MTENKKIPIGGQLDPMTADKVVTESAHIIDTILGQRQSDINAHATESITDMQKELTTTLKVDDLAHSLGDSDDSPISQAAVTKEVTVVDIKKIVDGVTFVSEKSTLNGFLVYDKKTNLFLWMVPSNEGNYTYYNQSSNNSFAGLHPKPGKIYNVNGVPYVGAERELICIHGNSRTIDGGRADSQYGGVNSIDCGGAKNN